MKFIRLDLLTLLISLFILGGCKNQDTIGLGVISSNQISGNLIDSSTIVVNTVREDSLITNGLSRTPLSFFKDPVFGTTEANLAIDLNLPGSSAFTLPVGTVVIDSAMLVLRYAPNSFYGDSIASRYKANVYQLKERILSGHTYYSNKTWSADKGTLLGSKSFISRTGDSIKIITPIAGAPDTLIKVPPQLRIPISTSFVNSILYAAPAAQLSSNLIFKNNVNGLYVTLDQNQSGPGGTFMFALDSAAAVQIYYRNTNGSVIDTGVLVLPSRLHAAEIKHTHSNTIKAELANSTTNRKTFYLQSMGGLKSRISFPYLKNILKTIGGDVIVNHAELVVTAAPGSTIPFAPLPKLAMYRYDLANQVQLIQDAASSDPRYFAEATTAGFYDLQHQNYHFLITAYIQDLMRGKTTDYGTFIGPVIPTSSVSVAPTAQVDGRTIAVGFDTASPYRIKLNLFYTKVVK
ncbi:DUF4270 family protein [Mucilaginibacter sp. UR6-11]|uniref:DUF4270 family protein n=1 Tax=Mucilaginibacter sp. UR6-11 TaxID=1435644 RepID=UPI001E43D1DE|nr:DUF4270 family protein [Mucilaginibacter sp. UR6-11]MCC8424492.1 DUF4270 domain-containing protein [Mucilaginibacter sp. UR6-11]